MLWFISGLVLLLIWFQSWFWQRLKSWFWCWIASKSHQNNIKTPSKSHQTSTNDKTIDQEKLSRNPTFFETNPPETPPKNRKIKSNKPTNIIKSSWQHRFDIVSKPYISKPNQNQIKTIKQSKTQPKPVRGLFLFPFLEPTHREPWKKICSQSISKPGQNSHPKQ